MYIVEQIKNDLKPCIRKSAARVLYLDAIKLFSGFLIVFYHLAYYRLDYNFTLGAPYLPNANRIIMCFASCSVPLFFMVNGALMLHKKRDWKYIYYKAAKIVVLALVWGWTGFPSWFLFTMAVLYGLIPVLQYAEKRIPILYYAMLIMIFCYPYIYNFLVFVLKALSITTITIIGKVIDFSGLSVTGGHRIYSLLYFCLGNLIYRTNRKIHPAVCVTLGVIGWIFVVFECAAYTNFSSAMHDGVNNAFPTVGALLLSVGVFCWMKEHEEKCQKLKRLLGTCSGEIFGIYVFHMMAISWLDKLGVLGFEIGIPSAVVISITNIVICIFITKVIKRIPGICFFVGI